MVESNVLNEKLFTFFVFGDRSGDGNKETKIYCTP
jgi:hypothetical protein